MKEFPFLIDEPLRKGIAVDDRVEKNGPFLLSCDYFRPTQSGLQDFVTITNKQADFALSIAWPFPQLFKGREVTLLCDATAVYLIDESDWSKVQITTYDTYTEANQKDIPTGGPWHFMDFGTTWMLFNDVCQVYQTAHNAKVFIQDSVTIRTGTDFKAGRAIYAGFEPTDYWIQAWRDFWTEYTGAGTLPTELAAILDVATGPGTNWVSWSSIGGGDMLYLFNPARYTTDPTIAFDLIKRGEMGLAPMPWQGTVQKVQELGNSVIVYGTGGITALVPFSSPVRGMAPRGITGLPDGIGVASRNAAGGHKGRHIFIDESGYLWMINADLTAEKLGYQHIFAPLLGTELMVLFEKGENEFWIGNGTVQYVLTRNGLAKAPILIHTIDFAQGGAIGVYSTVALPLVSSFITETYNLGERGFKHIVSLAISSEGMTAMRCRVHYRNKAGDAFAASPWKPVNNDGYVHLGVSAKDFRIELEGTRTDQQTHIDQIELRYQKEDRNYVRGPQGVKNQAG